MPVRLPYQYANCTVNTAKVYLSHIHQGFNRLRDELRTWNLPCKLSFNPNGFIYDFKHSFFTGKMTKLEWFYHWGITAWLLAANSLASSHVLFPASFSLLSQLWINVIVASESTVLPFDWATTNRYVEAKFIVILCTVAPT